MFTFQIFNQIRIKIQLKLLRKIKVIFTLFNFNHKLKEMLQLIVFGLTNLILKQRSTMNYT